jgi:16S rRNA processing protein RimM
MGPPPELVPDPAPELVVLGTVAGAHGVRGQVRVRHGGDGPENLLRASRIWLGRSRDDAAMRCREVREAAPGRPGEVRLALEGVGDRDEAQALRGLLVLGARDRLEPLPRDAHYWHELVGCRVEDREGAEIGTVEELWETGAPHDVMVVRSAGGDRYLVPTARELLIRIDLRARRLVVDAIPGLLEPL